jgi:hypothetical protein
MEGNSAEVRRIVESTKKVEGDTADLLKALALAGTIVVAAYLIGKAKPGVGQLLP